jgi:D-alanyl-D-alanine carboxypeptidase
MTSLSALHRALGIPANYAADRRLELQREAAEAELVVIGHNPHGTPIRLVPGAANAWAGLRATAQRDGIELILISGFRSIARQAEIIRDKMAAGQTLETILRQVAAPGFSEHHTGRALDIGAVGCTELEEAFGATSAFRWLEAHGSTHGFRLSLPRGNPHGIAYEPWHWYWLA